MTRQAPKHERARGAAPAPGERLEVALTRRADGTAVLRCTRADGSVTWQRQDGARSVFFAFHDLTHFAVESVLGARDGFFGLIAAGWDITETGGKGARGPLPPEAVLVEHVVGFLDQERVGGAPLLSAADVLAQLAARVADGHVRVMPALTDAQLDAVRARKAELHDAWANLPEGATLTLAFERPARSRLASP